MSKDPPSHIDRARYRIEGNRAAGYGRREEELLMNAIDELHHRYLELEQEFHKYKQTVDNIGYNQAQQWRR